MLSRVADSLYWMSRYLERAEHTTRLLEINLNLMLDESAAASDRRWQRVLDALGKPKDVAWTGNPYALTQVLTFDTGNKSSILSCIISARENARHVREQISSEQWQRLNSLYLEVTHPAMQNDLHAEALLSAATEPTEFLARVMDGVHQFQGVSDSTMSHGEGWQFIQVGRFIERATSIAMLLEAYYPELWSNPDRLPEPTEYLDWMGLLRSATAFEAYCKVYTADLTPDRILEFLLLDSEFPHSLRFSIDTLQRSLVAIEGDSGKARAEHIRRLAGRLQAKLRYASVDEILNEGVIDYLKSIKLQCRDIHESIYELYIDYSIQAALAS